MWAVSRIGNGAMTPDEYRTHLNLWAVLAAPLMLGNDVRIMTRETLATLKRVLGAEHPQTLTSIHNLATTLQAEGGYSEAAKLCGQALEVRRRVLGRH